MHGTIYMKAEGNCRSVLEQRNEETITIPAGGTYRLACTNDPQSDGGMRGEGSVEIVIRTLCAKR